MRAITYTEYGPPEVLRLAEVAKPVPLDGEVLVRIRAAALNPLDWHFMRGAPYPVRMMTGLSKPKAQRLGVDMAGQVEAVGKGVTRFQAGDEVFGVCRGALAEFGCTLEHRLAQKPANLTFEQAAAVPVAACTALQGLRDKGKLQPGQKVLVNGAAGGVGTFAVQIARAFGAEVTGVCTTKSLELVRSIGAHHVIDYTREDFTRSGKQYDLIFDTAGNHSLSARRQVLTSRGTLLMVGAPHKGSWIGPMSDLLVGVVLSPFVSQNLLIFLAHVGKDDLMVIHELIATGKVTPVIDRSYPLSDVREAIRYLEEGHTRGKVVITVAA